MKALRLRTVVRGFQRIGGKRPTVARFAGRSPVGGISVGTRQCNVTGASNSLADAFEMNAELGYATIVEELEELLYRKEVQSCR